MTDPLIEIAEALEREADHIDSLNTEYIGEFDRVLAARIRAFWTPQRQAFYEAAIAFCGHGGESRAGETTLRVMLSAYRSMVESERGESGNG